MNRTLLSMILTLLMVSITLAGCAKPASSPTPIPTQSPPKMLDIGIATPLTGPTAYVGTQISDTILMVIDDQNNEGGVTIAGQKYTLNPIIRDTKFDVVVGKSVAEELVFDKGVKVIIGPFVVDAVAVQTVTERNKVLLFGTTPANPKMIGPDKPYTFFCGYVEPQTTYKLLSYAQKYHPQAKTVFSLEGDVPDAMIFVSATQKACDLLGYNYLGYDKVPVDTRDFTSTIARTLPKNPGVIDTGNIGGVLGGLVALMIKQMRQAGYNGLIMIPAAGPEDVMENTVPAESLNNVITQYINADGPVVDPKYRDMVTRFNARYKIEASSLVPSYYDVTKAFFEFLNTQNTMDTTAWMQGFAKFHWQSLMGFESSWIGLPEDGINRRVLACNWVTHYVNGKPVTDYTAPVPWELFAKPSP